jgi:hypothetical protein
VEALLAVDRALSWWRAHRSRARARMGWRWEAEGCSSRLGWDMWRNAAKPIALKLPGSTSQRSFWLGLLTQLSNPKTAVVYASVFVSLLPAHMPLWAVLVLPMVIFWAPSPAAAYLHWKASIDHDAGH